VGHEDIEPGSLITGFDHLAPVDDKTCQAQVEINLQANIPDIISRRTLAVIANGPSAKSADLKMIYPTLALNGSMEMFTDLGLAPTYWAVCDPQERVADLLPDNPPKETVYLVASKCHPAVMKKLKGRKVYLWHISDHMALGKSHVAPCCSVTMSVCWLMFRLGYTDFEFWGWDGCFIDGKHHAGASEWGDAPILHMNFGGKVEDGEVIGGKTFTTTRSWAAEAKGAEQFFQLAKYFDIGIKIHGDGMFECARKVLMDEAA